MGQTISSLRRRRLTRSRPSESPRYSDYHQSGPEKRTPETLVTQLQPIYTDLLREVGYKGAPPLRDGDVEELRDGMLKQAAEAGFDIEGEGDPVSLKAFRHGFVEALAYPDHPLEVKVWIGNFTWLVLMIDDGAAGMEPAVTEFPTRFARGEPQPNRTLEALAVHLRDRAYRHWDPLLANLIVTGTLNFLTANALELRPEFHNMTVTRGAGREWPYHYRNMSGITEGWAFFVYPKAVYPDIAQYLEAIPDMAIMLNIFNDVVSFYKEELAGETDNYIHNRAKRAGKSAVEVVADVKDEVVACVDRIRTIMRGRGKYADAWEAHTQGHIGFHTMNPRYRLADMGLGEESPWPLPL